MDIFSGREVNIILSTTVRYRGSFLVFPLGRCTKSTCAFVNHPFIKLISYYHMNRPSASCKIFKNILLFIWLHWVLVMAWKIFNLHCSMPILNCGMGDLVPWPGIEPWPPTLGVCGVLASGPGDLLQDLDGCTQFPFQCRRDNRCQFNSWVRKIAWRRKWQPTPVFLPRESHGQRSAVGYCL